MSALYYRINKLCTCNGINITTMCSESGVSRSSLTDLKMGRKLSLSTDTLRKIANYFGVSIDFLLGEEPEKEDAVYKFGICWDPSVREEKKSAARAIFHDPNTSLDERVKAGITVLKALFSRSLQFNNCRLDHVDLPTYISMILWQGKGIHNIPDDVYEVLVEKYGTRPGIPEGTYFYFGEKENCSDSLVDDAALKQALFGSCHDITDEMLQAVKRYAKQIAGEA